MAKIKRIEVTNLKAIDHAEADFNGCTAIITAGNNKGKTSFLRSLTDRLRSIKPDYILKYGEDEGEAKLELTTGETFIWSFDNKTKAGEKLTFITKDNIKVALTKEISKKYFPPSFDIDTFLNASAKDQVEIMLKVLSVSVADLDAKYQEAYNERTYINKRIKELDTLASGVKLKLKEPESVESLLEKKRQIETKNEQYNNIKLKLDSKIKESESSKSTIARLEDSIKSLMETKAQEEAKLALLEKDIVNGKEWLDKPKNKPEEIPSDLTQRLKEAEELRKEYEVNQEKLKHHEELKRAQEKLKSLVKTLDDTLAERKKRMTTAGLPAGFEIIDDTLYYNGFPFNREQMSSSGVYIGALKLASLTLGEVRSLYFDASFLDRSSLEHIEKWAKENDLQLLIEKPDFDGGDIQYTIVNN